MFIAVCSVRIGHFDSDKALFFCHSRPLHMALRMLALLSPDLRDYDLFFEIENFFIGEEFSVLIC